MKQPIINHKKSLRKILILEVKTSSHYVTRRRLLLLLLLLLSGFTVTSTEGLTATCAAAFEIS